MYSAILLRNKTYIRCMFQLTAQSRRVQVLLKFLREQVNKRATFLEMLAHLNDQLPLLEQKKSVDAPWNLICSLFERNLV
jgi:hypothetical protein